MSANDDANAKTNNARGWVLIVAPLLAIVLFIAAIFFGTLAAMFSIKPMPTEAQVGKFVRLLSTDYTALMVITVLTYVVMLLAIWLLLPKRGPAAVPSYFRRVSWGTFLIAALTGFVFALGVGFALSYLAEHRIVSFHTTAGERALMPQHVGQIGAGLLAIALAAPLVEELYFRGLLLRWLRTRMPLAVAAVPSAALFAAIHFRFFSHVGVEGWVLTAALFLFGLVAAAWAGGARSVWPSFAMHSTYNATLVLLPFAAMQMSK